MALITNNISGSASGASLIGVTGSLIFGNAPSLPALPGIDTTFFVSGTRGGRNTTGVATFGGDVVISGAIAAQDGIGGFSPIKLNTDVGLTGSLRLSKQDPTPVGTSDEVTLFASGTGGATKLYFGVGGATSEVAVAGGGAVGAAGQIQFSNGTGGFSASPNLVWDTTLNGGTLKASNLFVTGTTTVVSSTNFVVTDPVVMVGSGAAGTSQPSLLAFANGSSTANDDLIIGASNGIIKVATYNTTGGLLPVGSLPTAFNTLASMQVDNLFVGSTGFAGIKNDGGGNAINISGSATGGVTLTVGTTQQVKLLNDSTNYLNFKYDSAVPQTIIDAQSRKLLVTGSQIVLQTSGTSGNEGVSFVQSKGATTQTLLNIISGSSGVAVTATTNLNLVSGPTVGNGVFLNSQGNVILTHGAAYRAEFATSLGSYMEMATGSVGPFNNASIVRTSANKDLVIRTTSAGKKIALADNLNTFAQVFSGSIAGTSPIGNAAFVSSEDGQALVLSGASALVLGAGSSGGAAGYVAFVGTTGGRAGLFPAQDKAVQEFDLGGANKRWANIYTGDLHLKNERGDYTLIEEEDCLTIRFNKTGKRYKFVLERAPEYDET